MQILHCKIEQNHTRSDVGDYQGYTGRNFFFIDGEKIRWAKKCLAKPKFIIIMIMIIQIIILIIFLILL